MRLYIGSALVSRFVALAAYRLQSPTLRTIIVIYTVIILNNQFIFYFSSIKFRLININLMVLKVGLCSLYAARATNLLIRAEPMQRHILD